MSTPFGILLSVLFTILLPIMLAILLVSFFALLSSFILFYSLFYFLLQFVIRWLFLNIGWLLATIRTLIPWSALYRVTLTSQSGCRRKGWPLQESSMILVALLISCLYRWGHHYQFLQRSGHVLIELYPENAHTKTEFPRALPIKWHLQNLYVSLYINCDKIQKPWKCRKD